MTAESTTVATPAWIMAGRLRNVAGVLAAGEGRIAFVADEGPVFSVPLSEVGEVTWPWHWFGGGCTMRVVGEKYKITFVKPNGAPDVSPSLLDVGTTLVAALAGASVPVHSLSGLLDVRSGRRAGATWKQVLVGA